MNIRWDKNPVDRVWEELTLLEQQEAEVSYLQKIVPEHIVDYLDLSEEALDRLHTCLENVLHKQIFQSPEPEQRALASLGRVVLSMWRSENSEDIQAAYLHREIEL